MATVIVLDHVEPDRNARRDLWRMLTPANVGDIGATAGVAAYHPVADRQSDAVELGAAHQRPEIYFVLDGSGELHTPTGIQTLSSGEVFCVPGGVEHTIVGVGGPVRTFYVSLKGNP